MRSARLALVLAVPALLATGCNRYDWFRLTGLQQEGFSNKADILFVIDNSPSMTDEADALATNFSSFIQDFAVDPPERRPQLSDEVGRYLEYVHDRSGNLNYQIGITTTALFTDRGELQGSDPVLSVTDEDVPPKFQANLLCDAACVTGEPSVDVQCTGGSRPGIENCADNEMDAAEEGIEPVFMAMCRAVEDPPEACFQEWYWWPPIPQVRGGSWHETPPDAKEYTDAGQPAPSPDPVDYFDQDDVLSNDGFLREGSVVIPVVVTDEGDQSRRIPGRTGDVFPYPELFRAFGHRMTWALIGPNLDCNLAGAAEWGVQRYQRIVADSNGLYLPIDVEGGSDCVVAPFDEALTEIGRLLRGLADTFPLATLPVPESIVVNVNGARIREAEGAFDDATQTTKYGDGWHYDAGRNAVVLTGSVIPDYDANVDVWYLPAQDVPRELPF